VVYLNTIVHFHDYIKVGYRDGSGVAAGDPASRLLHRLELLFSDNISIRLLRDLFAQGQDTRFTETDQGDTNATTEERV